MDKRTIIFRADAGPEIGMGHFTRTLALAEMLRDACHCVFVTREPSSFQMAEAGRICHRLESLPAGETQPEELLPLLQGNDIVVLDNYFFDTAYQQAVRAKGCRLVCIDDIHDRHFVADLLINHTGGIGPAAYSAEPYTRFCLGYDYALVRQSFREPAPSPAEKKYACVVMMGGVDPFHTLPRVLEALALAKPQKPVAVISAAKDRLTAPFAIEPFSGLSAPETAALMQQAGYGIFPASTVALEACALRLPVVCGYFIGNQAETYQSLTSRGMALGIGRLTDVSPAEIAEVINKMADPEVVHSIKARQEQQMDNRSAQRLLKIFSEL